MKQCDVRTTERNVLRDVNEAFLPRGIFLDNNIAFRVSSCGVPEESSGTLFVTIDQ